MEHEIICQGFAIVLKQGKIGFMVNKAGWLTHGSFQGSAAELESRDRVLEFMSYVHTNPKYLITPPYHQSLKLGHVSEFSHSSFLNGVWRVGQVGGILQRLVGKWNAGAQSFVWLEERGHPSP